MMIAAFALLSLMYMRGWLRLRATSAPAVGRWQATSFLFGLALIWIAVGSSLASRDAHFLTVHMVQHLLLMAIAPPLIWLGESVRVMQWALSSMLGESAVLAIPRWRPPQDVGRLLGHPVVCWLAAAAALVAWHVPALLTMSMHSSAWHAVEHLSFLAGGLFFWWPVVRPWPATSTEPGWSIVLYLFMATLPCDALSGFLVFSERIAYPMYASAHRPASLSALDDQQLAGALMWTVVTVVYLIAATMTGMRALAVSASE